MCEMKNLKAEMFNKKAADPKNKPDKIIELMDLKPGQIIADIGSGGGYFSLRFAEITGVEGKVYVVDINPDFLQFIESSAEEKGLGNIVTVLTEDKLDLPESCLDFVFMRNVTHHISNRTEYFKNLKRFLKSSGRIVIIEYEKGGVFTFRRLFGGHNVPKKTIINEMKEAGYKLEQEFDFLPHQHFTIFSK
jgi:arsenite methyltransferase